VDLVPPVDTDCKVQGPTLYCVPVQKQNVRVEPPAPGAPAGPEEIPHLCYKLKCAKPYPGPTTVTDQFGTFNLIFNGTSMLCTPIAVPSTPTTTTSTTTSSTTTTLLPNGIACSSNPDCASGWCVDTVCCDTACDGLCETCIAAKQVSGAADGTCG